MSDESERTGHQPVSVDVTNLSEPQRDMLRMRLRGDEVPFGFAGETVSVPAAWGDDLREAVRWVTEDLDPMETDHCVPRPFRRELDDGRVIASRARRFLGGFLDGLLGSAVYLVASEVEVSGWIAFGVIGLSAICLTRWFGGTPGKVIVGMRVIDAQHGGAVGWRGAAVRWLVPASLVVVAAFLGANALVQLLLFVMQIAIYAPILWDPDGQGLHDRMAQTMVLQRGGTSSSTRVDEYDAVQ